MGIAQDMQANLTRSIALAGMSAQFYRAGADASVPGLPVRFLMRHPGLRDEAVVNAYGVNAQIITLQHGEPFTAEPPKRFDFLVQHGGLRYVFDAVVCRAMGDVVIAWTAYVKGKGT